ncbi:MAG: hypothetical protein ACPKPY_11410 [Nitrososphaeraceae archaeon]
MSKLPAPSSRNMEIWSELVLAVTISKLESSLKKPTATEIAAN